jgi:drug/metabolite transporter (DMT)-like permease
MKKGVISVVVASVIYGMLPIFSKWILLDGVNSTSTVFYRMFASMLVSFAILKLTGTSLKATGGQIFQMALFGILGFGLSSALLTVAYDFIPVGLASMLLFAYPLYVNVIMVAVFKEKITVRLILSCALSLVGLVLLCDFSTLSATGIVCAILSGVAYGVYIISNKKGNFVELHGVLKIFYVTMAASIFFGARAVISGLFMLPTSPRAVFFILCLALFTTVLPQYLLTYGIKALGASTASVLNMLEPVMDVVLGWFFFREVISPAGKIGCVLIVLSGIIIALDTGRSEVRGR